MGLNRNQYTTQIDHYDNFSEVFDILRRINIILIDFTTDIWHYISLNYFQQKIKKTKKYVFIISRDKQILLSYL